MFVGGAVAFPGYYLSDVLVVVLTGAFLVLAVGGLLALMFPRSLRRWLGFGDDPARLNNTTKEGGNQ